MTITYQSNQAAILQLRETNVHGGAHNQAVIPASPDSFTAISLNLENDFLWLGSQASSIDLSDVGKFNFAFLAQNQTDGFAEITISQFEIENYSPLMFKN